MAPEYTPSIVKNAAIFMKQLRKAVTEIKKEAHGNVCRDCAHFVCGMCLEHDIEHGRDDAVACRQWRKR